MRSAVANEVRALLEEPSAAGHLAAVEGRVHSVAVLLDAYGQSRREGARGERAGEDALQVVVPEVVAKAAVRGKGAPALAAGPLGDARVAVTNVRAQFAPGVCFREEKF